MTARTVLDRVVSLAAADELAADPESYAAAVADELAPATTLAELESRDAALQAAIAAIDELATRVMRIRIDHALADDTALGPPTRRVFASTIVSYAGDLARLAERVRAVAERGAPPDRAAHVVDAVIEAARATLALRDALRDRVFARVADLARASLPEVDLRARDRKLDDAARKRWSAARRDLEILAAEPAKILAAPFAERLAAWPELIDEPNEPEVTFADMIELD